MSIPNELPSMLVTATHQVWHSHFYHLETLRGDALDAAWGGSHEFLALLKGGLWEENWVISS